MDTATNYRPTKKRNVVFIHRKRKALIICIFILVVALIGVTPFIRPKESKQENRNLAEFPKFTFSALFDGSFFDDVSTWYSDTVPGRDALTSLNLKIQNLLGTAGVNAGFSEVKDVEEAPSDGSVQTFTPEEIASMQAEKEGNTSVTPTDADANANEEPTVEDFTDPAFNGVVEQLGTVVIVDNAGYEYYNFVKSTADNYAKAVNYAAALLKGKTNVYCMVVPLSSDITLNSHAREKLNSTVSDQKNATDYIYNSMSGDVKTVPIFDTLKAHRNEYIYFRTDHHWTGLGAYYAYTQYCKIAGLTPVKLEQYKLQSFDNFLGTFYNDSGQNPALSATPDTVDTYYPPCEVEMTVTDNSGQTYGMPLIYDESKSTLASVKYSAFISGDNPYSVIDNKSLTSGDTLVVVKESFGNAIVPLFPPHYKTIYVLDYRYWSGSITDFCQRVNAKDLLFCNNISMTRSSDLVSRLSSRIG